MNYINNINAMATGNALLKAAELENKLAVQNCEIMACIQSAINSIVIAEVRELVRNGMTYGRDEVPLSARQDLRLIAKECDLYEQKIEKTVRRAALHTPEQRRSTQEYLADTADMLDDSDEILNHYIKEMDDIIDKKVPKGGPTCPRDPWLIKQLLRCTMLNAVGIATYESNERMEPYLKKYKQISYMHLTKLQNLIDNLYRHLTPLNKYGQHMIVDDVWVRLKYRDTWQSIYREKIVFNAYAILTDEKIIGKNRNEKGVITGGLLRDMRNSLYSTRFIDRLIIKRDGYDLGLRHIKESLLTNLSGDRSIDVPEAPDKEAYLAAHPEAVTNNPLLHEI